MTDKDISALGCITPKPFVVFKRYTIKIIAVVIKDFIFITNYL
jgi:hypothetical protein